MHYRKITKEDLSMYLSDIISCYQTNTLVFDSQNYLKDTDMKWFIDTYIEAPDSLVTGIFDDEEEFLDKNENAKQSIVGKFGQL